MKLSSYVPFALAISACTFRSTNSSASQTDFHRIKAVAYENTASPKLNGLSSTMCDSTSHENHLKNDNNTLQLLEYSLVAAIFLAARQVRVYNDSIYTK